MKDNNKKYWRGIEELSNDPDFLKNAHNEFPEFLPMKEADGKTVDGSSGTDRRDFLKLLGFGVAAASLAACEAPVNKAIPYLNKPVDVDPGVANYYASTYSNGGDYCSIVVKTREGRPIKIEGNKLSSVTQGVASAQVQASILGLYDETRLRQFVAGGKAVDVNEYAAFDKNIIAKLEEAQSSGKAIRIVSSTIISPSTKKVIADFKAKYPATEHITYDAHSVSGLIKANEKSFGKAVVPSYDFSKAQVIVSFGADFLGTWISPIEYARQYAVNRKLGKSKKTMSKHYQFESNLSLTGSNADHRVAVKPSQEGLYIAALYNKIAGNKISVSDVNNEAINKAATHLVNHRGKSLVVSGSNDVNIQLLVNAINSELGNYGATIDITTPTYLRQGDDEAFVKFAEEVKEGKVGAVIFYNANPVYDHPFGAELAESIKKVPVKISFADREDETSSLADYIAPDYHYLEAWNDAEPKKGFYSLTQPTITPLFKGTRAAQDSLLIWSGSTQNYYSYLQNNWKELLGGSLSNWDKTVQDGVFETAATAAESATPSNIDLGTIAETITKHAKASGNELKLYEKVGVGNGCMANNPWLQELPDPVSKATWGNYLAVSIKYAEDNKLKSGDVVTVSANGKSVKVPVVIQPGQNRESFSLAIGYGRTKAGNAGNNVGANAYPFVTYKDGTLCYAVTSVEVKPTGEFDQIAQTQTHHTIMGRPIIQESVLEKYQQDAYAGRHREKIHTSKGPKDPEHVSIWYEHDMVNHHWGMTIDLNSCIGCGACVVACNVENNIPVVGKTEVINRREMHWMRIDRYYSSKEEQADKHHQDILKMELPEENPEVTFQPMLCQQCNHAPCETVCPVAATTHSSEGLNQMAYNRCVGTRYCANNCPYKVRRFNWFKYFENSKFDKNLSMNNALGRMVLNPDVTVRSRGVMEKCTFCVQRIQAGKLEARKEKRTVKDGEIVTACAATCPTNAIVFGDLNDKESKVYAQVAEENKERAYHVLEEIDTRPNVAYLTKIRNKKA